MKKRNLTALRICLPLGLALAFSAVACGGDDSSGNSNTGGTSATSTAGSKSTGGSSSSTGGSSSSTGGSSASTGGKSNTGTAGKTSTSTGGSSSGGLDTGLPSDKPLSDLTADEFAGLCDEFDDLYSSGEVADNLKEFNCRFAGLFGALLGGATTDEEARAACKVAYDQCIVAPAESTTSMCDKPSGTCTATVGELEACANDSAAATEQLAEALPSCADLSLADLMDMNGEDPTGEGPASCEVVSQKCPDGPTPASPGGTP